MRLALKTRDVVVPAADRQDRERGERPSSPSAGLNLKVEEARRIDAEVPAGQIISQDPQPGVRDAARAQRQGLGQRRTARDHRAGAASANPSERRSCALQQDGLQLAAIAEIRSADYPPDTVVAQNPPAPRAAAARVALLVNRGERGATYVMPDLIGVNGDRAADLLRTRGFRVVGGRRPSRIPACRPGSCCDRVRRAAFRSRPGDPISLEVSR